MNIRRKLALLSSCALVLQNFAATLPAAAFDTQDNMAAFLYWKLPLGGSPSKAAEPTYGFSVGQTHDGWLFAPPDPPQNYYGDDVVVMPALVDMHFGGGDGALPSVAFSGVDVVPVFTGQLNAADQPGSELSLEEWLAIGIGSAMVIGGGVCAAICGDSGHHNGGEGGGEGGGGSSQPAS